MTSYKPLTCSMFGGESREALNALYSALTTAAHRFGYKGDYAEYEYLENAPRTSLIVELHQALKRHGYEIRKIGE